ncbi:Serine/threonine-protein kinase pef1-like protein [Elsinoe fawcettii]|nr:Serine/threonine-protein kinase pef1-like protein [Elsinoe fawcettii]
MSNSSDHRIREAISTFQQWKSGTLQELLIQLEVTLTLPRSGRLMSDVKTYMVRRKRDNDAATIRPRDLVEAGISKPKSRRSRQPPRMVYVGGIPPSGTSDVGTLHPGDKVIAVSPNTVLRLRKAGDGLIVEKEGRTSWAAHQVKFEKELLTTLSHRNIVKILEPLTTMAIIQDAVYMEHLGNKDLSDYLDNDRFCTLPPARVHDFLQEIPGAIRYLAEHEVEHNDIKPENIMVSANEIKLIDFGLSTQGKREGPRVWGTAAYCSLDMLAPDDSPIEPGKRDVYAFMVTLLFALGWRDLPSKHPFDIYRLDDYKEVRLLKELVDGVVQQCEWLEHFGLPLGQAAAKRAQDRMSAEELCEIAKDISLSAVEGACGAAVKMRNVDEENYSYI